MIFTTLIEVNIINPKSIYDTGVNLSRNRIGAYVISGYFLLMLVLPSQYQYARGALLALILISSLIAVINNPNIWTIRKDLLVITLLCISVSFESFIHGYLADNPGALQSVPLFLIWPLIFIWIAGLAAHLSSFILLSKTLIIGSIAISLITILIFLGDVTPFNFDKLAGVFSVRAGLFRGAIKISSPMTPVMFFLLPYLICFLTLNLITRRQHFSRVWRIWLFIGFFLTVICLLISGRSAFWLIALISVPISITVISVCGFRLRPVKIIPIFILIIFMLAIIGSAISEAYFELDYKVYFDLFVEKIFRVSDSESVGYRRYEQFHNLLDGILVAPLFGQGLGAVETAHSDIWQFELSFVSLIFQVGIVGFIVYTTSLVWVCIILIKISRNNKAFAYIAAPILAGMSCFLIASSTNPLLFKFDFLWVIFLPLALANYGLRNYKNEQLTLRQKQKTGT